MISAEERYHKIIEKTLPVEQAVESEQQQLKFINTSTFGKNELASREKLLAEEQNLDAVAEKLKKLNITDSNLEQKIAEHKKSLKNISDSLYKQLENSAKDPETKNRFMDLVHEFGYEQIGNGSLELEMKQAGIDTALWKPYIVSKIFAGKNIPITIQIALQQTASELLTQKFENEGARDKQGNYLTGGDWERAHQSFRQNHGDAYFQTIKNLIAESASKPVDDAIWWHIAQFNVQSAEKQREEIEKYGEQMKEEYLEAVDNLFQASQFPISREQAAQRLARVKFRPSDILGDNPNHAGSFQPQTDVITLHRSRTMNRATFFHELTHAIAGRTKISNNSNERTLITGLGFNLGFFSKEGIPKEQTDKMWLLNAIDEATTEQFAARLGKRETHSYTDEIDLKALILKKYPLPENLLDNAYFRDYGEDDSDPTGGINKISTWLSLALKDSEISSKVKEIRSQQFIRLR